MPLTDPEGNPIPADDPRLPSPESTQALQDQADAIHASLEGLGVALGPLADIEARMIALENTLIPPDGSSPARRVFDYRLQKARIDVLGRIAKTVHDAQEAAKKPRIEVASAIPADYRRG